MNTTVTLDEQHFRRVAEQARALGKTPEQYLQTLIEADSQSFDEILGPAREGFALMTDDELDVMFERARAAARHPG